MKPADIAAAIHDLREQADSHARVAQAAHQHTAVAQWREIRALLDRALAIIDRIGDEP